MLLSEFIDYVKVKRAEELLIARSELIIRKISKTVGIVRSEHLRK